MRHYLFKRPLNNIHMVLQACRLNRGRVLGVAPHLLHSTKLVIWTLTAFSGPNAQDPLGWWFYPGPNPLGGRKKWIEEKKNNKEEEKSRRKKEKKNNAPSGRCAQMRRRRWARSAPRSGSPQSALWSPVPRVGSQFPAIRSRIRIPKPPIHAIRTTK